MHVTRVLTRPKGETMNNNFEKARMFDLVVHVNGHERRGNDIRRAYTNGESEIVELTRRAIVKAWHTSLNEMRARGMK